MLFLLFIIHTICESILLRTFFSSILKALFKEQYIKKLTDALKIRKRWLNLLKNFNVFEYLHYTYLHFFITRWDIQTTSTFPRLFHIWREERKLRVFLRNWLTIKINTYVFKFQGKLGKHYWYTHLSAWLSKPANSAMLRTSRGSWQQRNTATITRRIREKLGSVATLFLGTLLFSVWKTKYPCGFRESALNIKDVFYPVTVTNGLFITLLEVKWRKLVSFNFNFPGPKTPTSL